MKFHAGSNGAWGIAVLDDGRLRRWQAWPFDGQDGRALLAEGRRFAGGLPVRVFRGTWAEVETAIARLDLECMEETPPRDRGAAGWEVEP